MAGPPHQPVHCQHPPVVCAKGEDITGCKAGKGAVSPRGAKEIKLTHMGPLEGVHIQAVFIVKCLFGLFLYCCGVVLQKAVQWFGNLGMLFQPINCHLLDI